MGWWDSLRGVGMWGGEGWISACAGMTAVVSGWTDSVEMCVQELDPRLRGDDVGWDRDSDSVMPAQAGIQRFHFASMAP